MTLITDRRAPIAASPHTPPYSALTKSGDISFGKVVTGIVSSPRKCISSETSASQMTVRCPRTASSASQVGREALSRLRERYLKVATASYCLTAHVVPRRERAEYSVKELAARFGKLKETSTKLVTEHFEPTPGRVVPDEKATAPVKAAIADQPRADAPPRQSEASESPKILAQSQSREVEAKHWQSVPQVSQDAHKQSPLCNIGIAHDERMEVGLAHVRKPPSSLVRSTKDMTPVRQGVTTTAAKSTTSEKGSVEAAPPSISPRKRRTSLSAVPAAKRPPEQKRPASSRHTTSKAPVASGVASHSQKSTANAPPIISPHLPSTQQDAAPHHRQLAPQANRDAHKQTPPPSAHVERREEPEIKLVHGAKPSSSPPGIATNTAIARREATTITVKPKKTEKDLSAVTRTNVTTHTETPRTPGSAKSSPHKGPQPASLRKTTPTSHRTSISLDASDDVSRSESPDVALLKVNDFLRENGYKLVPNSGNGNNCAIYSMIQALDDPIFQGELLDRLVVSLREEYDAVCPNDKNGRMLHLDGGKDSAVYPLIELINKRFHANIQVKVAMPSVEAAFPITHIGTFPEDSPLPFTHELTIFQVGQHFQAAIPI